MKLSLKIFGINNLTLKLLAIIFGYLFWVILAQHQKVSAVYNIPLCFYGLKENFEIIAPESIQVNLSAKRLDLANINIIQTMAIHVDISKYTIGEHKIKLNENDIFLHNKIKLIDYIPSEILIQIKEKQ